jgi:hypothetical protein
LEKIVFVVDTAQGIPYTPFTVLRNGDISVLKRSVVCVLGFLFSVGSLANAQSHPSPPPFVSVPAIEDREIYYAFFNYLQGLIDAQRTKLAADPQSDASKQMAALLGVDVQQLPIVVSSTQAVTGAYAALAAERLAFKADAEASKGTPTMAQMSAQFELKRARITADGVRSLFESLSVDSWAALHGFITGVYKNTIYKK